jgi:peptidylprolyl isomerase
MKRPKRALLALGFSTLLGTACGGPSAKPAPLPALEVEPPAPEAPKEVVLEYDDKGAPTNYLLAPEEATPVEAGGKALVVGVKHPEARTPQESDVAVVRMSAWNHEQVSMMGPGAGQEYSIPVFDAPKELREVFESMHAGEKARVWVPDGDSEGGTAIIDIELLKILSPPSAPDNLAKAPEGATPLANGLLTLSLEKGEATGEEPTVKPEPQDVVTIEYTTWSADGKVMDASMWNPAPTTLPIDQFPDSLRGAVLSMIVGDKIRVWIPPQMSDTDSPLVTDIRLLALDERPAPPPTPENVAKPPKKAKKTKSGLRYLVLERKATGKKKPRKDSEVEVHYTGWTTDGKIFDSSVVRGVTAKFPLDRVIPGWTEGLQLMRPGQRFRFWIPEELAYKGMEGSPQGMLVFDVELIAITE